MPKKVPPARKTRSHKKAHRNRKVSVDSTRRFRELRARMEERIPDSDIDVELSLVYRQGRVTLTAMKGLGSGHVSSEQQREFIEFLRSLPVFKRFNDEAILIAVTWKPGNRTAEPRLAEITKELQESLDLLKKHPEYQMICFTNSLGHRLTTGHIRLSGLTAMQSVELVIEKERDRSSEAPSAATASNESCSDALDRILPLLVDASPEQQQQLGKTIAEQYERTSGNAAAFVTLPTFRDEFFGVRDASTQLKRSRSAITTYVQDGLLPAVRLDEKQYVFFKKHIQDFIPPKRGPRFKS